MRRETVQCLTAPGGGAPLAVATVGVEQAGEIVAGTVASREQGLFLIREGILDLLPHGVGRLSPAQASNRLGVVARGYEWPWRARSLSLFSRQPLPLARERAIFDELLGGAEGGLWLDLAASTALYGRWLAPRLAQAGGEVVALDVAWAMLRQARTQAQREGVANLAFVRARGEALPFATATLDGVVCGGSLNEFGTAGAPRVLGEVARALRPGGVALFMHLLRAAPGWGRRAQQWGAGPGGIAFWDRADTERLFEAAGLQVEARRDFGVVAFSRLRRGG